MDIKHGQLSPGISAETSRVFKSPLLSPVSEHHASCAYSSLVPAPSTPSYPACFFLLEAFWDSTVRLCIFCLPEQLYFLKLQYLSRSIVILCHCLSGQMNHHLNPKAISIMQGNFINQRHVGGDAAICLGLQMH